MNKKFTLFLISIITATSVYAGVYMRVVKDPFNGSFIARIPINPVVVKGVLVTKESLYIREIRKDKTISSLLYIQLYFENGKGPFDKDAYLVVDKQRVKVELANRRLTQEAYYPTVDGEIVLSSQKDALLKKAESLSLVVSCKGKETLLNISKEDLFKIKKAIKTIKTSEKGE